MIWITRPKIIQSPCPRQDALESMKGTPEYTLSDSDLDELE